MVTQENHQNNGPFNPKFHQPINNKNKNSTPTYDNNNPNHQQQLVHAQMVQQQQIWAPPQQGAPLTLVLPQQPTTSAQRFPATSSRMIVELPN